MMTPYGWWKLLRRIFKIDRRSPERRPSFRPRIDQLEERWVPAVQPLAVTGQPAAFIEGNGNTAAVLAYFTDPNDATPDNPTTYSVVVNWGDGSASSTIAPSLNGSTYTVSGSHQYADETAAGAPYQFTVTVLDTDADLATGTGSGTAVVADAPLTPVPATFAAIETFPFSGTVGTFTDANPLATTADFTATIDWGDGSPTTTGTVTGPTGGPFTVSGTHTYAEDGPHSVSAVVTDDGGSTATIASTANVQEGNFILNGVAPITATEGTALSNVTVATFTDPGSPDPASAYTATIDWGDGTVDTGTAQGVTITGSNGTFTVTGSHTYQDELSGNINVTVMEPAADFTLGPNPDTVTVAEGDTLTGTGGVIGPLAEGEFAGGPVGFFSDTDTSNTAGDFTATIDWGDNSTTPGNITGGNGSFTVTGAHGYADEGSYTLVIKVAEDAPGTAKTTITSSTTVQEADTLTPAATQPTLSGTEGTTASGPVAVFNDSYSGNLSTDFSATIDWGDGSPTTTGTVSGGNGSPLTVSGSHTYAEDGTFTPVVTLIDDSPSTATGTATGSAVIAEADLTVTAGLSGTPTEGQTYIASVATISDPGSSDPASDYTATIDWGDGTTTTGTAQGVTVTGSNGRYVVNGSHLYTEEGAATVTVTVTESDAPSPGNAASASATATVADAPLADGTAPASIGGTEGSGISGPVATFTDANPNATAADFPSANVIIHWGDGTSSNGTVTGPTGGPFTISGSHTYVEDGNYPITADVTDVGGSSLTAIPGATAGINEAGFTTSAAADVPATEGVSTATVPLLYFNHANGLEPTSSLTANIDWGDGHTDTGVTLTQSRPGAVYTVAGSHTYAEDGTYATKVEIIDDGSFTTGFLGAATANVAEADLTVTAGLTATPTEGTTYTGQVATISDPGSPDAASDYTATIDWGDGTTDTGTVVPAPSAPTVSTFASGMNGPDGLAFDSAGNLFVANFFNNTIDKVTPAGAVSTFSNGNLNGPKGVAIDSSGNVFVANYNSGNIAEFSPSGTLINSNFNTSSVGSPDQMTIDSANNLYVYDALSGSIFKVTPSGTVSTYVSGLSTGAGGLAFDQSGNLYVTDYNGNQIDKVPPGGGSFTVFVNNTAGLNQPRDIVVDPTTGNLYVSSGGNNTIFQVTPAGVVSTYISNSSGGNFNYPYTLALDGSGNLYVANGLGSTVSEVTPGVGSFVVNAPAHTYADEGSYTVTVTVTETDAPSPGNTASNSAATTVAEADNLDGTGPQPEPGVTENDGTTSFAVAYFTDTGYPNNSPSDFTATINWGDGSSTTAGTVSASLTPSHWYRAENNANDSAGTDNGTLVGNVSFAPGQVGQAFSFPGQVGSYVDLGTGASLSGTGPFAISAWIKTSSNGVIIQQRDSSTASGEYILSVGGGVNGFGYYPGKLVFSEADNNTLTDVVSNATVGDGNWHFVVVQRQPNGTVQLYVDGAADMTDNSGPVSFDNSLTTVIGEDFRDQRLPFNGLIDEVQLYNGALSSGEVSAAYAAGQNHTPYAGGGLTVSGSHAYADEGVYTAVVTLTDDQPGSSTATVSNVVTVTEADVLTAVSTQPTDSVAEGDATTSQTVAVFSDSGYPTNSPTDFSATIDWGDGTSASTGTVTTAGDGNFTVAGTHAYADEGTYTATVILSDANGPNGPENGLATATATATNVITATEADTLAVTPTTINATEGHLFRGTIANFSSTYTANVASDFTALILWGDNTSSDGVITGGNGSFTVTGSHVYTDEGTFTPTVFVADDDPGTATADDTANPGTANVAEGDTLTGTGTAVSSTQLAQFSGTIATFHDTGYPSNPASDFTASIDWGDGTTSAGTIAGGGAGGFRVSGSHTYAGSGSFTATVTLTDDAPGTASATAASTVTVTAATVNGTFAAVATTEGRTFSGTVATFSDAGSTLPASAFTASIDWGDGTTTAGTVTGTPGSYTVTGSHVYTDEGTDPVAVTLSATQGTASFASTPATGTATVAEGDTLTAIPLSANTTEGQTFSGAVAAFTDTYAGNTAGDFTATIDWGDGSPTTAGTVTGSGGSFSVIGSHSYADEGSYTVTVTLTDDAPGTATATASSTAYVAEGDVLTPTPTTITPTEGTPFSGAVASFKDAYAGATAGDFTATIDWGDGTTDTGAAATITGDGQGNFVVAGSHAYADEGSFTVTVTLADDAPGTATATAVSTANVAEGDFGTLVPQTITATEGTAFSGAVASFTDDGNPLQVAGDFTATIDWGDGSPTTAGTVTGPTGGPFTISGTHTYADEGTYNVVASFSDDPPSTLTDIPITSTAVVAEADTLATSGTTATLSGTEGTAIGGTVATFTDTGYATNPATDFTATIDWGDSSPTTTGTVTGSPGGPFTVAGTHTYAEDGVYHPVVTLLDDGGGSATASTTAVVNVAEAAITGTVSFAPTEGTAFTGTVATFSDPGSTDAATDYTATIDWGDGITDTGAAVTVTGDGQGHFTVAGSHTYVDEDAQLVTVTLTETDASPAFTATASGSVTVAEGDSLTGSMTPITATEGTSTSGAIATFKDTYTGATAGDFTATIDWGDGTTDTGAAATITGDGQGNFVVAGSHTYADEGSFTVTVTLTDDAPGTATASASAVATVSEADSLSPVAASANATEGTAFTGSVATFTDTYAGADPGDFTASINWGDGTTSAGSVTGAGGNFTVVGSHTYADEGIYTSSIVVKDDGPGTANFTIAGTVGVAEGDVLQPQNILTFGSIEGAVFSGTIAAFQDSGYPSNAANNPEGDFTATIDWGDGTTTTGTVSSLGGGFLGVAGSHTYADEGTFTATAVITDDGHGVATGTATAVFNVADADTLSATGMTITATEGTTYLGNVATFTDTFTGNVNTDFAATIDWGDGTPATAGSVSGSTGRFTVAGGHTYAEDGSYTVIVTVTDDGGTGGQSVRAQQGNDLASATATSTANVAEAIVFGTVSFAPTEGATFTGTVATFSDPGSTDAASNFTAQVVWGDGTTTAGTVTANPNAAGGYLVSGSHTYADEGAQAVTVTLTETSAVPAFTASASATVTVAEGDALSGGTVAFSPTEATAYNGAVATFSDSNGAATAADFSATISWGDGSSVTAGTVTGGNGTFTVSGSHTYADEGTQIVVVTLTDDAPGTAAATAAAVVTVAEGDTLTVSGSPIAASEGAGFTNDVVATVTDSNAGTRASDLSATINWGDGTSSAGTLAGSAGSFSVTGSHTYAEEGTYTITSTVSENAPGTARASGTATATVQEVSINVFSAGLILTAGQDYANVAAGGLLVGTFADPAGAELDGSGGNPAPGEYSATIAWGDGSTSAGTITYLGSNTFAVHGDHAYATEGQYHVTLTVQHGSTSGTVTGSVTQTAFVGDAPLFLTYYNPPYQGQTQYSGQLASFVDYDLNVAKNPNPAAYTVTVNWGDGTVSSTDPSSPNYDPGLQIFAFPSLDAYGHEEFAIGGSHTFSGPQTQPFAVTVYDKAGGGSTYYDGRTTTPSGQPKSAGTTMIWVYDAETNTYQQFFIAYS